MVSNFSVLGDAVQRLVAHIAAQAASLSKPFVVDERELYSRIDNFAIGRINNHYTLSSVTAMMDEAIAFFEKGRLEEVYKTCIVDHQTVEGIKRIRIKYGTERVDVAMGRLIWDIVFELTWDRDSHRYARKVS